MNTKTTTWRIKGMNRDMDPLVFNNEFAYENRNIRITASSDSTLLGITNIKGTSVIQNIELSGVPIGGTVISDYLILFTTSYKEVVNNPAISSSYPDNIYRISFIGDNIQTDIIARGNFNFSTKNPIEALPFWEANDVINVYWTDGRNQMRKINIVDANIFGDTVTPITASNKLDFVASFDTVPIEDVTIEKQYSIGNFPSGVIQYFITAYNKFGNETNILYESPLYYTSPNNRGGAAEESNVNSFKLSIDTSTEINDFEYLRIYSIHRTSLNSEPSAYIVKDIQLTGVTTYTVVDTGYGLESIDPTSILFKEREIFSVGTFAQKDSVLFIGDVHLLGSDSNNFNTIRDYFSNTPVQYYETFESIDYCEPNGVYPYNSNLDESNLRLKGFKCHDYYKVGLQFQRKTGEWTSVIPIKFNTNQDWIKTTAYPRINYDYAKIEIPKIAVSVGGNTEQSSSIKSLLEENYIAVRAVIAEPIAGHKSIKAQGVLCPTLFNIQDRKGNSPYSISSWFIRPCGTSGLDSFYHNEEIPSAFTIGTTHHGLIDSGGWSGEVNFNSIAEIQNSWHTSPYKWFPIESYTQDYVDWMEQSTNYIVDQNILTFHSPDVNNDILSFNGDYKIRIVGIVPITSNYSDFTLQVNSNKISPSGLGKLSYNGVAENLKGLDNNLNTLYSAFLWNDAIRKNNDGTYTENTYDFLTYPWHREGSLNNDRNIGNMSVGQSAVLNSKIFSNLKYSYFTSYFRETSLNSQDLEGIDLSDFLISTYSFNSNELGTIRLGDSIYMGNVDKVATWVPFNMDYMNTLSDYRTNSFKALPNGYPIVLANINEDDLTQRISSVSDVDNSTDDLYEIGTEPVNIRYKSTSHVVFQLPVNGLKKTVLPAIHNPLTVNDYDMTNPAASLMRISIEDWDNSQKFYCIFWGDTDVPTENGTYFIYTPASTGAPPTVGHFAVVTDGSINHNPDLGITEGTIIVDTEYRYGVKVDSIVNSGSHLYYVHDITANDYITQSTISINDTPSTGEYEVTIDPWDYNNIFKSTSIMGPFLYMAEIYEDIDAEDIYGSDYNNIRWNVASKAMPINDWTTAGSLKISGDTYFQRWDCLKTYPFTEEDKNSVVEIVSFMVETKNNIAARTDRNRGMQNNTFVRPTNFNLYNTVYNQSQDFIASNYLRDSDLIVNSFPNTIYWSLSKTLREEIDTWAAITLTNTLDMDGDKGRINAIRRYNNNLLVFQDTGLAQILYNENMQITSTEGVPIEIANSGLVSGKRYLSNTVGCENKWTIVTGEDSIYFMDNYNKGIYKFNGNLNNLTSSLGFNSWSDDIKIGKWLPENNDGSFLSGYDRQNKEVHFMNNTESLVYSEQLGLFMTFMDIKRTPFIFNVKDKVIATNREGATADYNLYELNTGNYNSLFGTSYPFYVQVTANPEPTKDKVFNTLEFRADSLYYNSAGEQKVDSDKLPFHTFKIWNEYQDSGNMTLQYNNGVSNLKRKFRIWRINNFRNVGSRDRIRNPWAFLKLINNGYENSKVVLHDMVMYYSE